MSNTIRCYTLFHLARTGVRQRGKIPEHVDMKTFIQQRNSQANLDTILQIISLRSQPEIAKDPIFKKVNLKEFNFGFVYEKVQEQCNIWYFDFEVQHASVFNNGLDSFGYLYSDCETIPMIKVGQEHDLLSNFLETTPELKNIYFEFV